MFPPHVAPLLRRFPAVRTSEIAPSYDEMEHRRGEGRLGEFAAGKDGWTGWEEARKHVVTVYQEPGETIFVPSNWYHEVLNLTDCVSVRCANTA